MFHRLRGLESPICLILSLISLSDKVSCTAKLRAMLRVIWIGLAGFVGTLARYWLSGVVARRYGETFPYGTLAVNAAGCLFAGALFYLMYDRFLTSPTLRSMVFIGLLGGFTTFSSYGLQTFTLLRDGELLLALVNIAASNIAGLFLVWAGYRLAGLV